MKLYRVIPKITCIAMVCFTVWKISNSSAENVPTEPQCVSRIGTLLQRIHLAKDEDKRGDLAELLVQAVHDSSQCGTRDRFIDKIIPLLRDRNDSVRWGAAAALGELGPLAKKAIPALKKALNESDAKLDRTYRTGIETFLPTRYSGQAIRAALKKIAGMDIPDYGEREPAGIPGTP